MTKTDGRYGETVSGLYPTKTRLALLADIAAGHVYRDAGHWWHEGTAYRLDATVTEVVAAGWAKAVQHPVFSARRLAALTPAGREVLEAHRG